MDIGIGLPNAVRGVDRDGIVEWARRAEAAGFSSLGTIDRIAYPNYESLIALAAAAAVTERIRLVTDILIAPLRANTALLAKQARRSTTCPGGRSCSAWRRRARGRLRGLSGVDFHAAGASSTSSSRRCRGCGRGRRLVRPRRARRPPGAAHRRGERRCVPRAPPGTPTAGPRAAAGPEAFAAGSRSSARRGRTRAATASRARWRCSTSRSATTPRARRAPRSATTTRSSASTPTGRPGHAEGRRRARSYARRIRGGGRRRGHLLPGVGRPGAGRSARAAVL